MADIRLWNKEFITEFLAIYKNHPCLWKIKSDEYKNKKLKEKAYNKLVNFCKEHGLPEANRDFVVKKIQSLRGSFRKELKKVYDSLGTKDIYKPNLWYYNLLLFTKDQEAQTDWIKIEVIDDTSTNEDQKSTSTNMEEQEIQEDKTEKENYKTDHTTSRKRSVASTSQTESPKDYVDVKSNCNELTEFDAVGINVAKKMAKMDPLQAIYAESIINNVLRRGLLKKLTEDTDLCD